MGKFDIIQTIFDSYELFKEHYREIAIPLIFLVIASGIGHVGGSGGGDWSSLASDDDGSGSRGSGSYGSLLANAIGPFEAMLGMGIIVIVLLAVAVIALFIILAILKNAVEFYVYEHFYALLQKKKIAEDWQARLTRQTIKVLVMQVFGIILTIILFAVPVYLAYSTFVSMASVNIQSDAGPIEMISSIVEHFAPVILAFLAALAVMFIMGFFLSALWIYFAMDRIGFFDSIRKSFSLVWSNKLKFLIVGIIFGLLAIGGWFLSLACCCFAWIISPIVDVFLTVLYGITLMKMKLALEKK